MRPTLALRSLSKVQLTLFTRANCGLCDVAKARVGEFRSKHPLPSYIEVDIMGDGQQKWRDVYEFDVPVLHVERVAEQSTTLDAVKKLMHRFTAEEVERAVHEVEGKQG